MYFPLPSLPLIIKRRWPEIRIRLRIQPIEYSISSCQILSSFASTIPAGTILTILGDVTGNSGECGPRSGIFRVYNSKSALSKSLQS